MELVLLGIGIAGVVSTLAGSWYVGSKASLRSALEQADIIIGMLATKVGLLEDQNRDLKERLGE